MTERFDPILPAESADRFGHVSRPGFAFVYTDAAGGVVDEVGNGAFRWFNQMRLAQHCVDIGDHFRFGIAGRLPAARDAAFFDAQLDLGFRVVDPKEVVRRNLTGADRLAVRSAWQKMRTVARTFDIESAAQAECEVNARFGAGYSLAEGIEIFDFAARIDPDAASLESGAQRRAAEQHRALNEQGLEVNLYQLALNRLAEHSQDTEKILELLGEFRKADAERQDSRDKRADDLLRYLIDRGVLQAVDVERIRDELTDHVRHATAPTERNHPGWSEAPVLPAVVIEKADERPVA
jgi:hypothetical protein